MRRVATRLDLSQITHTHTYALANIQSTRADCECCVQRNELETLLAMERAARLAVERAAATMSRSHAGTPLHTPLRTVAKNGVATRGFPREMQLPLPEKGSHDVMGRHCADVVSYASPDARCGSARSGDYSRGGCAEASYATPAEPDHSLM